MNFDRTAKYCAKPGCTCRVPSEELFCSEGCRGANEGRCECEHQLCVGSQTRYRETENANVRFYAGRLL